VNSGTCVLAPVVATAVAVALAIPSPPSAEPFGVNGHTPTPRVVGEIAVAGIRWVRVDFVWPFVEPEQDRFDWRLYDALVEDLESRGLRIYATLQSTPEWATDGAPFSGVPRDPADWRDLCYRAAARYRGRVHAWGFWNEPNNDRFWDGSWDQYVDDILLAAADAVRAADPDALICGPDLAHLSSADWDSWLERVVRDTRTELDVVTHHLYPDDNDHRTVTRDLTRPAQWPWDEPSVREVLDDAGWYVQLPFWLTETGASSSRGEASQASFYRGLLADWFLPGRTSWWMSRVFFYHIHDDPNVPQETFGLLTAPPELRRKQAFDAYRDFVDTAEVDDAEVVEAWLPRFAAPGAEVAGRVTFRNTGTTAWEPGNVRLWVTSEPLGASLRHRDLPCPVAPGGTVPFEVALVPPAVPASGSHPVVVRLRLERTGRWWFGEAARRVVTVSDEQPATVIIQPAPATVWEGTNASLSVIGSSTTPLTYHWRRNSIPLADNGRYQGARLPMLRVLTPDAAAAGTYDCVLSNAAGEVVSAPAELRVITGAGVHPRRPDGRMLVEPKLWREWQEFAARARTIR